MGQGRYARPGFYPETEGREARAFPMLGQTLSIRIITDTYFKLQRVYRYKYEVLSGSDEHAGKVDRIFSEHCLAAGHHYEVRVNEETKNPRPLGVVRELERPSPTGALGPARP